MLTSSAKAKARALQNRVAKDLAKATGLSYGRPDDDAADLRGRQMGTAGPDLVRRWDEAVLKAVPFYVEARNRESWGFGPRTLDGGSPLGRWYVETAAKALKEPRGEVNMPLLVATRNHYPLVAVVDDGMFLMDEPFARLVFPMRHDERDIVLAALLWTDFLAWWYAKGARR